MRSRYVSPSSEEDQSSVARHRSSNPSGAQPSGAVSDQHQPQHDPDPPYYREVALSDIPSQYAEEVDTFRRILSLPDPRESMPRSSTSVMGLDDEKGHQELRPRGPSSMLPLSSVIKDTFDKFEHDLNISRLNTFVHVEKFKMETPESIRTSLMPGEWVSSIDLSNAYLHILIHPNSRKYLRFCYRSQVFQFTSLPFGLGTAPQVFTMIVKEVKLMALSSGLRLYQYLDDWLIRSESQEEAQVNTQPVVDLAQSLGWIINQEKSELKPTQVFSFMGYKYHLDSALVKPTQKRWHKLQDLILRLKPRHVLSATCLMSLIGLLASTEKMVLEGGIHMRPFQFHLKDHWRYPQSLDSLLPWTEAIAAHLDWWQNPSNMMRGADLHPKDHSIQLFTDASSKGWGAHLDQSSTKGLWSDQEKRLHINVLELKAVSLALQSLKDQCQNQTVLVATDNTTVVAYINKQGGTHSAEMCALLWKIMTWCHHYHITLKARHIPGCLNVMADLSSSKQAQSIEWSLHPQVFKQICQKWFTPHVDLFATHLNHKLPLYVSPVPDPKAWDIDALNINCTGLTAYAYPPVALLHRVIQKIRQCHCLIILIAPGWPGMPCFWDLVQLSTEIPLQLPVSTTLFKQSHSISTSTPGV